MITHPRKAYQGISPEELQAVIRRAHAERAAALRELFAGLRAWRRKSVEQGHAKHTTLRTAPARLWCRPPRPSTGGAQFRKGRMTMISSTR